ncbi:MAG TPA: hypothetical protein VK280_01100 [Streptosporangiaceae bacterium]|nr:hypothetical protein [Streptosporangiaceae bacterium]
MKYMLIHAIDPAAEPSTEGVPAFDSCPAPGIRCGSPAEAS